MRRKVRGARGASAGCYGASSHARAWSMSVGAPAVTDDPHLGSIVDRCRRHADRGANGSWRRVGAERVGRITQRRCGDAPCRHARASDR